jgi:hypothetical protein
MASPRLRRRLKGKKGVNRHASPYRLKNYGKTCHSLCFPVYAVRTRVVVRKWTGEVVVTPSIKKLRGVARPSPTSPKGITQLSNIKSSSTDIHKHTERYLVTATFKHTSPPARTRNTFESKQADWIQQRPKRALTSANQIGAKLVAKFRAGSEVEGGGSVRSVWSVYLCLC